MTSLRWFPRAWRARYGSELSTLLEQVDATERSSPATRFDIPRAGLAERLRVLAPGPLPPAEQAREGALLVLCAWAVFVVGGSGVAKLSEHWQAATPPASQSLPSHAFSVLYWTAGVGSVLVIAGVAISLPALARLFRRGGWVEVRRPLLRALLLSVLAIGVTAGLSRWAHSLTSAARNGGDSLYTAAFAAWFALAVSCLFAWVAAATAVARRLELSLSALRLETALAAAVGIAMTVMTVASAVWWASLANAAPWFFSGHRVGSGGSVVEPNMVGAAMFIVSATVLGLIGATRSVRGGLRSTM
jgi:hypothetical protein